MRGSNWNWTVGYTNKNFTNDPELADTIWALGPKKRTWTKWNFVFTEFKQNEVYYIYFNGGFAGTII